MSRRMGTERGGTRRGIGAAALVVCGLVAASCGGRSGSVTESRRPATAESTTSSTSSTSTSAAPETTAVEVVPETTIPVPDTTVAPPPVDPTTPITGPEHVGDGESMGGPPTGVQRPAPAWVPFGEPLPGSMFENLQADRSLDGKGKFVALTFDDGPSQYTAQIVQILRFMNVQATFFVIAKQALAHPDLIELMLASGMRIGSHTDHHPHLGEVTPDVQREEVVGSIDRLNQTFGEGTVKCFRPPYAQYDQHVLDLVAERGVATAMWSLDTLDWKKPSWQSMAMRVVNDAQDRSVILMHDGGGERLQTIASLPWIIQGLRDKGFQFLPIC